MVIGAGWTDALTSSNSLGIVTGLLLGKPAGVLLFSFAAIALGLWKLPSDLAWRHVAGAGLLAGVGFTMSIFITNLAFAGSADHITASKIAILLPSLTAGACVFVWLWLWLRLFGGSRAEVAPTS